MSVIGKKPFVNKIIDSCTKEQVTQVINLMDQLGTPTLVALYGDDNIISDANLGVSYVTLKMNETLALIPTGILIYLDNTHCGFFVINVNSDNITEYIIDPVERTYLIVNEYLTVEELRQVCGDRVADISMDSTTFRQFPESWPTTGTTAEFCAAVNADEDAIIGMGYMGGARFTDMPFEGNGDIVVEVLQGPSAGSKSIHLILTSGTNAPYHWEYTYWNNQTQEGWVSLGGGGLPEATKAGQVLVSNNELEYESADAAPMAENLTGVPENNEALYSYGPTGGLTDISTGEEAYLTDIKGYSLMMWRYGGAGSGSKSVFAAHTYLEIFWNGSTPVVHRNQNTIYYHQSSIFDLTITFGLENRVPFTFDNIVEYPANGEIPKQESTVGERFLRLFSPDSLILANSSIYNTGTGATTNTGILKNVSATKLVESGQNLWNENDQDMVDNGLWLAAGYRYEIYISGNSKQISKYVNSSISWSDVELTRCQRGDGKYVWIFYPKVPTRIRAKSSSYPIKFVGFVHSGNYCLTTGTLNNSYYANTNATIPAYVKHEITLTGISGLNGIPDNSANHCSVYDTTDTQRVGVIDLATLTWTTENNKKVATIPGIKPSTVHIFSEKYGYNQMSVDENGVLTIDTTSNPSQLCLFELAEPIATGNPAFTSIPIKVNNDWIVNDMGSEYFIGTDKCPVNQVSTYIANLKDKLVNLEETSIMASAWTYGNPQMSAVAINGTTYNLVPLGKTYNSTSLAIGYNTVAGSTNNPYYSTLLGQNASNTNGYGVAIGSSASATMYSVAIGPYDCMANANYCISIGYSSRVFQQYSIGIGYCVYNTLGYTVSFDSTELGKQMTYQCYNPTKIFFRNEVPDYSKNTFAKYTQGHFLNEYIQNNLLTNDGTDLTKYYLSYTDTNNYKTITGNCVSGTFTAIDKLINAVHITLKISGTTSHSVVGLDLLPYDATNSYGFTSYGRVIVDGTVEDITATIDSDGIIVITAPTGATIDEARYNIK